MAAKAPVLSPEEEIDLVKRAHKGDSVARNRFIIAQLPMLVYWADMSINWRVDKEDLIGFGVECVISALNSFNPNLENRFATYLGKNILYKMNDYHKREGDDKVCIVPLDGCRRYDVETGVTTGYDTQADETSDADWLAQHHILYETAVRGMTTRQKEVFTYKYGFDGNPSLSVEEIARSYGISVQAVNQSLSRAKEIAAHNCFDELRCPKKESIERVLNGKRSVCTNADEDTYSLTEIETDYVFLESAIEDSYDSNEAYECDSYAS